MRDAGGTVVFSPDLCAPVVLPFSFSPWYVGLPSNPQKTVHSKDLIEFLFVLTGNSVS